MVELTYFPFFTLSLKYSTLKYSYDYLQNYQHIQVLESEKNSFLSSGEKCISYQWPVHREKGKEKE